MALVPEMKGCIQRAEAALGKSQQPAVATAAADNLQQAAAALGQGGEKQGKGGCNTVWDETGCISSHASYRTGSCSYG